jgi:hypothetical protein
MSTRGWKPQEVRTQLRHTGTYATDVADSLLAWEKTHPSIKRTGGNGPIHATLRWDIETAHGVLRVLLLYADPIQDKPFLEIYVKHMLSAPRYDRQKVGKRLLADLRGLGIQRLLADDIPDGDWPSIPLSELTDGRLRLLLDVIDRWIEGV